MSSEKRPRVLTNDDGWILGTYPSPISVEQLRDKMVAPHEGSPFDTFMWNIGGREVFSYETHVGERYAEDVKTFSDPAAQTRAENLRHLIDAHGGPVTVIAQLCHNIGMKFFASLRMNTHYNVDDDSLGYGRFRREHPDLLIGRPGEDLHPGDPLWGLRTGKDYAFPKVRDFTHDVVGELVERPDVDGIELDFMRHPGGFRPDEAYANRYLLTDMIVQLRRRMEAAGTSRGQTLELAVRVAPTLADSVRLGMDVEEWIKEGLVDLVTVGLGFNPFEARIAQFVAAAEGTPCRILGCFEALRPVMDTEVLRAIAARYWSEGVDGLYFFNFYSMSQEWKRDVVGELAKPAALERGDKIYEIDKARGGSPESQIGHAFRYCLPLEQLPLRLEQVRTERPACLHFEVADDIAAAEHSGALGKCVLGLGFGHLQEGDEIAVSLNGVTLAWQDRHVPTNKWTHQIYDADWNRYPSKLRLAEFESDPVEFDLPVGSLRQGRNEIQVRLVQRAADKAQTPAPVLTDVRIWIRYNA
jgi:hypothetical protein